MGRERGSQGKMDGAKAGKGQGIQLTVNAKETTACVHLLTAFNLAHSHRIAVNKIRQKKRKRKKGNWNSNCAPRIRKRA